MQLCVWEHTIVGSENVKEFEQWLKDCFDVNGKFVEEIYLNENRTDVLFSIEDDDVSKFAIKRLQFGIRWWEDVLDNMETRGEVLYSEEILNKYPKQW